MDEVLVERGAELRGRLVEADVVVGPGVVHQSVDPAIARDRRLDRRRARIVVGQFGRDDQVLGREILGCAPGYDHRNRAFLGQPPRDGEADTGPTTRDDHDLAVEPELHPANR